jgi:hypothetical protein
MPDLPESATRAVAEALLRQYESQYDAGHLTWRDFEVSAREITAAAAPILAEEVARKILAHMDAHGPGPSALPGSRHAWRRHFGIAAQIASLAFSSGDDIKRAAAEAVARGEAIVCHDNHRQSAGDQHG